MSRSRMISCLVLAIFITATLTGCAIGGSSSSPEERIETFRERFPEAPLPRAPSMDPLVAMLDLHGSPSATLVFYSDRANEFASAVICVSQVAVDECTPFVGQERRLVDEVDGYQIYLFSGPDNIDFDSPMAGKVMSAAWSVERPRS